MDHLLPADGTVTCKEQLTTKTEHKQKLEQPDNPATSDEGGLPKRRSSRSTKSQLRLIDEIYCITLIVTVSCIFL